MPRADWSIDSRGEVLEVYGVKVHVLPIEDSPAYGVYDGKKLLKTFEESPTKVIGGVPLGDLEARLQANNAAKKFAFEHANNVAYENLKRDDLLLSAERLEVYKVVGRGKVDGGSIVMLSFFGNVDNKNPVRAMEMPLGRYSVMGAPKER